MGVLDELKKEAATVKAQEEQARTSEEAQRDAVLQKIRPKMQSLYGFFRELAENLNVVEPDIRYEYEIAGFGSIKGLLQHGYRVSTPDNRTLAQFTFHFNCASEGGVKFQVKGKEAAERQRQSMWQHNLRFTFKSLSEGTGVFFLETYVPITFEFESQMDRGAIRLRVRNLDLLGTNTIYYEPDQLNDEFLNEIGKAILRKPNRFNELSGNTLSDDARRRLRQQLAHDGYKRLSETREQTEANPTGVSAAEPLAPPSVDQPKKRGLLKGLLRRD